MHTMEAEENGSYTCELNEITESQRYAYWIDRERERPDPASRWQPEGVHKPSAVWRPESFEWSDKDWQGISKEELVLYELHVGTFTNEGTFAAIIPRITQLRDLGVTAIELMPVAQFPGRWSWGYDGVYWNAVQSTYGGPRELQRLINACHKAGLAVFLDVVYNHFGPEGNYLVEFGPYLNNRFQTPWGPAVNYNDQGCHEVRSFVRNNVRQWVHDFHIDGLRLDATHSIFDFSPRHILAEIKAAALEVATDRRHPVHIIAECNLNDANLLLSEEQGGHDFDALWNDDFHHCVHTLVTGEANGYYIDYSEPQAQLAKVMNRVFAYDGDLSKFRGHRHGLPVENRVGDQFVVSIQNHDQVGNRANGERLSQLTGPAQLRLAASLMLLSPYTPLLFMGEEYGERNPFPFFCDFADTGIRSSVRLSRRREFQEMALSFEIPDSLAEATFMSAKLNWPDQMNYEQPKLRQLYIDLLAARRRWPALRDRRHRSAQLISSTEGHSILRLTRGDPHKQLHQIEIYFNLVQHHATLPSNSYRGMETLMRTEDVRYGGMTWTGRFWGQLNPFECVVFKHARDEE